jgi:hypothetical protein
VTRICHTCERPFDGRDNYCSPLCAGRAAVGKLAALPESADGSEEVSVLLEASAAIGRRIRELEAQ